MRAASCCVSFSRGVTVLILHWHVGTSWESWDSGVGSRGVGSRDSGLGSLGTRELIEGTLATLSIAMPTAKIHTCSCPNLEPDPFHRYVNARDSLYLSPFAQREREHHALQSRPRPTNSFNVIAHSCNQFRYCEAIPCPPRCPQRGFYEF